MRERITDLRDTALAWLYANLPAGHWPHYDAAKGLGELALLCEIASRYPRLESEFSGLRRYITAQSRTLPTNGTVICQLRTAVIRSVCGDPPLAGLPDFAALPANPVELKYYLRMLGAEDPLPSYPELCARSLLWSMPGTATLDRFAVYEATHTLFCASDFGRFSLSPAFADRLPAVAAYVAALLDQSVLRHDWDLVAELLISGFCVGLRSGPSVTAAWAALSVGLAGMEDTFAGRFHPTVTTLLACLLELEGPR